MPRILPRKLKKRPRTFRRLHKKEHLHTLSSSRPANRLPTNLPVDDTSSDDEPNLSTDSSSVEEFMDVEYLDDAFDETRNVPDPIMDLEPGTSVRSEFFEF